LARAVFNQSYVRTVRADQVVDRLGCRKLTSRVSHNSTSAKSSPARMTASPPPPPGHRVTWSVQVSHQRISITHLQKLVQPLFHPVASSPFCVPPPPIFYLCYSLLLVFHPLSLSNSSSSTPPHPPPIPLGCICLVLVCRYPPLVF
jgi:hypothetical protein